MSLGLSVFPQNAISSRNCSISLLQIEVFSLPFPTKCLWMTRAGAQRPTIEFLNTAAPRTACKWVVEGRKSDLVNKFSALWKPRNLPGGSGPAKLPLQSWPYFKDNSKMQLSKSLIPSPEKPRTLPQGLDLFTSCHRWVPGRMGVSRSETWLPRWGLLVEPSLRFLIHKNYEMWKDIQWLTVRPRHGQIAGVHLFTSVKGLPLASSTC